MKLYQIIAFFLSLVPSLCFAGEWNYNIEGQAQALYGYTDIKEHNHGIGKANISASAEYSFSNKDVLSFNLNVMSGIDRELQDYNQGRWGEEFYAVYDSAFGQLMLGQVYNVASLFHNGVFTTGALSSSSDVVDFLSNPNWQRNSKKTYFATLNSTDINTDGVAPKINYISPEFYGTAIGFSYMPDSYNRRGLVNKHVDYIHKDGFVGAIYNDADFDYFTSQASLGYAQYHGNDKELSVSLRLNRGNWNIGGGYRKTYIDGDDKLSFSKKDMLIDFDGYREGEAWNVGVGFEFGPAQSSLSYFESSSNNTDNQNKMVVFSNQYQFNKYIDIYLATAYVDYENIYKDTNGYVVVSGIGVSF